MALSTSAWAHFASIGRRAQPSSLHVLPRSEQIDIAVDLKVVRPALPEIEFAEDLVKATPAVPPQLVEGVVFG
jgi:hypothetical protein